MFHAIHTAQEGSGQDWWAAAGFGIDTPNDPRLWAQELAANTGDAEACDHILRRMCRMANKKTLKPILKGANI